MTLPNPKDALHRSQLYHLLVAIADNTQLAKSLIFKGGTCAAMLNYIDRFSVDLDFDLKQETSIDMVKNEFEKIFKKLKFEIKSKNNSVVQYALKYSAPENMRNTLKLDAIGFALDQNIYKPVYLLDIDRYLTCQTVETMFAHKLAAVLDRHEKHETVAGRDIYDIYCFFLHGHSYNPEIILKRTSLSALEYLKKLKDFIELKVNSSVIDEDLNMLMSFAKFRIIRKSLKAEVVGMLKNEIERLKI